MHGVTDNNKLRPSPLQIPQKEKHLSGLRVTESAVNKDSSSSTPNQPGGSRGGPSLDNSPIVRLPVK